MRTSASWRFGRGAGSAALAAVLALAPCALAGQGAVDPNVAPRASELNRQGERPLGIELLGRYLAVAQSDGRGWFLLSRFYRMNARDWHRAGHRGDPSADVYLSLASVAVDESIRLHVDSAPLYRALVDVDRSLLSLEDSGWDGVLASRTDFPPLPPVVAELARNFAASCPANGVLITGSEVEWLAAWYGALAQHDSGNLIPLRADLFVTDSLYRQRMSAVLGIRGTQSLMVALTQVAARRPLCLTPSAGLGGMPVLNWTPVRLVRVSTGADAAPASPLSFTAIVTDVANGGSTWTSDVLAIYAAAAHHNDLLCQSLAPIASSLPAGSCGP